LDGQAGAAQGEGAREELGGRGGRARDLSDRRHFRRLSGEPQVSHFLLLLGKNFRILTKLKRQVIMAHPNLIICHLI